VSELPIKLENCPIVDAVAELRFKTTLHRNAVFGVFYEKVRADFTEVENLPILQIPPALLGSDPNLLFKPHQRLRGKRFSIQIGPDVVSVSPMMPYPGWNEYFPVIRTVFNALIESKIPTTLLRVGMRYTNFFAKQNVFEKVNLDLLHGGQSIPFKNTVLRTDIVGENGFNNTLQMSNSAQSTNQVIGKNGNIIVNTESGSVLDVDTYKEYNENNVTNELILNQIELAHENEKSFFWNILNDEARKTLKPIFKK
jgi:uncharacterized protein (TIGR04255 family)